MDNIYNMRNVMESIEHICEVEDDSDVDQVAVTPEDLIKDIVQYLKTVSEQIQSGEIDDRLSFTSDLQNIRDMLSEMVGQDDDAEETVEENLGTEDYAPDVDTEGHRTYNDPNGDSYAAKNGFVG